jgi:hypothetical protein
MLCGLNHQESSGKLKPRCDGNLILRLTMLYRAQCIRHSRADVVQYKVIQCLNPKADTDHVLNFFQKSCQL